MSKLIGEIALVRFALAATCADSQGNPDNDTPRLTAAQTRSSRRRQMPPRLNGLR